MGFTALTDHTLGIGQAEDADYRDNDVAYLRSLLGGVFVDWILAVSRGEELSRTQLEAAQALASVLRGYAVKNPGIPVAHMASWLAFYHESSGTTFINYCRLHAGGTIEELTSSSSDRLLTAVLAFAGECYGELLLPNDRHGGVPDFFHYAKTEVGRRVVQEIYDEGIFPVGSPSDYVGDPDDTAADYFRSLRPGSFASGLIWCAWNLAKLEGGIPTPTQLESKIPIALEQLRSSFSGQVTRVTAVASLTGARLPEGALISGPWGHLRPARSDDHPFRLRALADRRTITTTEAGDQVEITDAGDIILETSISIQVHVGDDGNSWQSESMDDLGELIDKVRLAFALAMTRPTKPIIYTMWTTAILPMGNMEAFPLTDPQFMAPRTPTLLDTDEVASWKNWIDVITAVDMSRMRVAMTRTLKAMTERRDPSDRLIDAVIAWESLFGAVNESTLRVSASLARLLHSTGEARETAQKAYQKIYQARSDIVHANETKTTVAQIDEYGRTAIDASLRALSLMLTTHNRLLSLKSSARSTQVLLGDDWSPDTATQTSGDGI